MNVCLCVYVCCRCVVAVGNRPVPCGHRRRRFDVSGYAIMTLATRFPRRQHDMATTSTTTATTIVPSPYGSRSVDHSAVLDLFPLCSVPTSSRTRGVRVRYRSTKKTHEKVVPPYKELLTLVLSLKFRWSPDVRFTFLWVITPPLEGLSCWFQIRIETCCVAIGMWDEGSAEFSSTRPNPIK